MTNSPSYEIELPVVPYWTPNLITLFSGGDGGGNDEVLQKGIKLFSKFVSSEHEGCIESAIDSLPAESLT